MFLPVTVRSLSKLGLVGWVMMRDSPWEGGRGADSPGYPEGQRLGPVTHFHILLVLGCVLI